MTFAPIKQETPMEPIATIHSCYQQRFGIPRQASLVTSAVATIDFAPTPDNALALRDIETFSHLWVIFLFHRQHYTRFKPLVQPPRFGGRRNVGVYATRSPNRVNPIGLSAVKLHDVINDKHKLQLVIGGGDFLDGTPVLDIKPYVPFVDAIPEATSLWATPIDNRLQVFWDDGVLDQLAITETTLDIVQQGRSGLKVLIEETLAQDPRPAHEREKDGRPGQHWGVLVGPLDVTFKVEDSAVHIVKIKDTRG